MVKDNYAFQEGMADAELGRTLEDNPHAKLKTPPYFSANNRAESWGQGFNEYHRLESEQREKLDYENAINNFDPTEDATERELLSSVVKTLVRIAENNEAFQQAHLDAQKEIDQTLRDMWMELTEIRRKS